MDQIPAVRTGLEGGRPWWKVCCGGCLVFVCAGIVGGLLLIRAVVGPGLVSVSRLPDNFPQVIVPFHLAEAQKITYLEGRSKSKMLQVLAAPMQLFSATAEQKAAVSELGEDAQYIDTVTLTWQNLSASRTEIVGYYVDQLEGAHLSVDVAHDSEARETVTGITEGILVNVSVQGSASSTMADAVEMVVSYSNKR